MNTRTHGQTSYPYNKWQSHPRWANSQKHKQSPWRLCRSPTPSSQRLSAISPLQNATSSDNLPFESAAIKPIDWKHQSEPKTDYKIKNRSENTCRKTKRFENRVWKAKRLEKQSLKNITNLKNNNATQKTSKKSAKADFFLAQTSICDFIQKNCAPSSIIITEAETT